MTTQDRVIPIRSPEQENIESLRKDAARYRWLREQEAEHGVCIINVGEWTAGATCIATTFHSAEFADEMVDAAMSKETP